VGPGPLDDALRAVDRLAVVGEERRHPVLAGEPLDLAARGQVVDRARQSTEPVGADDLRVVA
jgi:hypothetical protein